ncbi:TIGR03905 family TSCPD domain-containing protein [Tannockella kyphosi]|uniref:TIGR03905 family TSCPD domain-containing protein n=1 Tax=Tannockella kyphosi TaxID=2899121 RepID=UPI002011FB05|nr:TIGR03905 family TSCPD domain-containing protein [Tannockella kyphosi]
MEISYKPKGVCASAMHIQVEEGKIIEAKIIGGCPGNGLGVCSLIKGLDVTDAIARMEGIRCGAKPTSCPDQLAQALKQTL